jgi:UDP-N-acetylmuramoyl-tripeptide--D-alanyl-D-alanine ligase
MMRVVRLVRRHGLDPFAWRLITAAARVYRLTLARRVRVVVVVGSVGKTTTVRAIAAVLGTKLGRPAQLNMNSATGVGRALLSARPWHRHVVIEAAINGPGQMRRLATMLRPDVVVVTAIASDHWRSMGTLETTRHEKAEMVRALRRGGTAILNADDENVRWMATQTSAPIVWAGDGEHADVRATDIELDWPSGMKFDVEVGPERHQVRLRLIGRHMVFPAVAALAVADAEGTPLAEAVQTLSSLEPTLRRMQPMSLPSGAFVLSDDYKASYESVHAALTTLAEIPAQRRIAVLGGLSESRGTEDYRDVGRRAGSIVDRLILVGSSKDMRAARAAAVTAGLAPEQAVRVRYAHEAVELLRNDLGPGDVVLTNARWQQALARVGLALAGRNVQCRADPCPIKRMVCDWCPYLERPFQSAAELSL